MDEENSKVELMVNCHFKWTDRTDFRKNVLVIWHETDRIVIQAEHTFIKATASTQSLVGIFPGLRGDRA